ncbi:hypothetical protein ACMFMF_002258 [Clarireedia jacksonii]
MAEPESAHHDSAHEGYRDGKISSTNETFADESGPVYGDDEVSIERIEKVYKKIDRRIIPGKLSLTLCYNYAAYFRAPLTRI